MSLREIRRQKAVNRLQMPTDKYAQLCRELHADKSMTKRWNRHWQRTPHISFSDNDLLSQSLAETHRLLGLMIVQDPSPQARLYQEAAQQAWGKFPEPVSSANWLEDLVNKRRVLG